MMMSSSSPRCHFSGRSDGRRSAGTFPSRSPLMSGSTRWRHASWKTGIIAEFMAQVRSSLQESVPVDAFQRLRTADCHGRGLYGPVDASSFSELRKKLENFPTFSDRVTIIHLPPTRALTTTKSRYGCSRSVCGDTSPNQHSRRCVRWAFKEI